MPRKEREKGKRGERWVVNEFKAHGFAAERRGWMQAARSKEGWVSLISDAPSDVDAPPFYVEVKNQKQANIRGALRQVLADCPEGGGLIPIAVIKDTGKEATVTMLFSDFLDFAEEWRERGEG